MYASEAYVNTSQNAEFLWRLADFFWSERSIRVQTHTSLSRPYFKRQISLKKKLTK